MVYSKRLDGRKFDETRDIEAKVGIVKNADGSAMFRIGKTIAYVAVYGPRNLHPKFLQNPKRGVLRCRYNMMPFSGAGNRVRPGGNRRSKEISMVIMNSLLPSVNIDNFPNSVVDVFIELPQTDAGTRCAGICAASMALAQAGIPMKELVSSVGVGIVDGTVVVDLEYAEEAYEEGDVADIPLAFMPRSGKLTLLQTDGIISKDNFLKAVSLGRKACERINEVQTKALKDFFVSGVNNDVRKDK